MRLVRKSRYLKISPLEEKEGDRPLCCFACRREDRFFVPSSAFLSPPFSILVFLPSSSLPFPKNLKRIKKGHHTKSERKRERALSQRQFHFVESIDWTSVSLLPPASKLSLFLNPTVVLSVFHYSIVFSQNRKKKRRKKCLSYQARKGKGEITLKKKKKERKKIQSHLAFSLSTDSSLNVS